MDPVGCCCCEEAAGSWWSNVQRCLRLCCRWSCTSVCSSRCCSTVCSRSEQQGPFPTSPTASQASRGVSSSGGRGVGSESASTAGQTSSGTPSLPLLLSRTAGQDASEGRGGETGGKRMEAVSSESGSNPCCDGFSCSDLVRDPVSIRSRSSSDASPAGAAAAGAAVVGGVRRGAWVVPGQLSVAPQAERVIGSHWGTGILSPKATTWRSTL